MSRRYIRHRKKKAILVGLLLLVATEAKAADKWSNIDKGLEIAWQIVNAADMYTTIQLVNEPGCYETNPILGSHPTNETIVIYGLICAIGHPIVTNALPKKWRPIWQGFSLGLSANAVYGNYSIMIKLGK